MGPLRRLGMNLNYRKGTHAKPWISFIEEGNCLIRQWNKDNPTHAVAVNDRVISVNGTWLGPRPLTHYTH